MTLKELVNSISKKEWRFVILLIIVMILLTTLPYIYAYYKAPAGYFYNGIHSLSTGDTLVYYSYINQIKAGNWQIKDYLTSESQPVGLLNFVWLIVGLMARLFNLQPFWAFFLFRLFLIPLCLIIIYLFASYLFAEPVKRKVSLIFVCFSSGIGVYFANLFDRLYPLTEDSIYYNWPIDLWVPEANVFLSFYQSPHFILSLILMVAFFLLMLLALSNNKFLYSLLAGLVGFFWFNFHPYYFPAVFIILFLYIFILFWRGKKWSLWSHYLLSLILSLPFVFYHYYMIATDFVIGTRAGQNVTYTGSFLFVLIGFGFLLILGLAGVVYLIDAKKLFKNDKLIFLFIWLVAGPFLLYLPFNWQRRFLMGLQLPMVFFTIIIIFTLAGFIERRFKELFLFLKNNYLVLSLIFIIFFGFSTLFNLVRDLYYFHYRLPIFYLSNDYLQAANWLKTHNNGHKIILSDYFNGFIIPSLANQQVYLAHGHETLFFSDKSKEVNNFFGDKYSEAEAEEFLKKNNIGYVFYTKIEKSLGEFDPALPRYLQEVFKSEQVKIFEFKG